MHIKPRTCRILPSYMKPSKLNHDTSSFEMISTCCLRARKLTRREVRGEREKGHFSMLRRKSEREADKQAHLISLNNILTLNHNGEASRPLRMQSSTIETWCCLQRDDMHTGEETLMREKLAEISHIDEDIWMNCLANIYFCMILCAEAWKTEAMLRFD